MRTVEKLYEIKCGICNHVSGGGCAKIYLESLECTNDEIIRLRYAEILCNPEPLKKIYATDIYVLKVCMKTILRENLKVFCIFCDKKCPEGNKFDIPAIKRLLDLCNEKNDIDIMPIILEKFDISLQIMKQQIYFHSSCRLNFESNENETPMKFIYTQHVSPIIRDLIEKSYGIELTEIRDILTELYPEIIFHNNKIKSFVETEFQEKVDFCHPIKKNDSLVIYPACIGTTDMIARIQNLNVIKKAGEEIRKAILYEQDYGLAGKLCNKTDLEFSL